ncbi:pilus assembly protein TadG-related protein [Mycetocola sp.]|uniref:pilus assembly protein TadG-related protein n=1 Tax=Mycetocola sp. TaxID=1871042 RepID=UPI00398959F8
MWWLNERFREERGSTAVLVGILLVPLIGFLAIAIDVGALYAERAQLQNGADAAALAVANDCAIDGTCDGGTARAQTFANGNANDAAANIASLTYPTANSVRVVTSTREAGTGAPTMQHPFAAVLGNETSTVHAEATAEWGSPESSTVVLPLAISLCDFRPSLDGSLQLIRYDERRPGETCAGPEGSPIPGGFAWIDRIEGECAGIVDLDTASLPSDPGADFPIVCRPILSRLEGATIVVPIFDGATITRGGDASYHYYGFAAFMITGWKFGGGPAVTNLDPAAPTCTGDCRGIQGRFVEWVSPDAAGTTIGGPDLGLSIVRLSR